MAGDKQGMLTRAAVAWDQGPESDGHPVELRECCIDLLQQGMIWSAL